MLLKNPVSGIPFSCSQQIHVVDSTVELQSKAVERYMGLVDKGSSNVNEQGPVDTLEAQKE